MAQSRQTERGVIAASNRTARKNPSVRRLSIAGLSVAESGALQSVGTVDDYVGSRAILAYASPMDWTLARGAGSACD